MSQETVEMVRRGYEHFNRSGDVDYSVLDGRGRRGAASQPSQSGDENPGD